MINESSVSSQLLVTITVCISVNTYCCKPYISWCYTFLALQGQNTFPGLWELFQVHSLQVVSPSTFMFLSILALWHDSSICLSFCFLLFSLYGPLDWQNPLDVNAFFLLKLCLVFCPGWSNPFLSQNLWQFYAFLFFDILVVHIPFVAWSNFDLLHNSLWITFPTQPCIVLYSFCATLLYLLYIYIYIWLSMSSVTTYLRGSLNKFPYLFRMGTFIDSAHMKLLSPSKQSPPAAMLLLYRSTTSGTPHGSPLVWAC